MRLDILNALDGQALLKELGAESSKLAIADSLARLGVPNKKTEKYRYFNIETLMQKDWVLSNAKQANVESSGSKIVITNGVLVNSALVDGVSVEQKEFTDTDSEHFDALYYLGHLLAKETIVVRVSKDAKFEIEHNISEDNSFINYRVVVLVDKNTHAHIYESFSGDAKGSFVLSGYDIFVSKDASLNFTKSQTLQAQSYTPILTSRYKIDANAQMKLGTFDFAKANGLNIFRAELHKNSNFDASHLLYLEESVKNGTISEIVHEGESSHSSQINKAILDNKSRGIFDALIRVQNSGKYTKAHQNSKAILLHSGAYMASKPQLEIYIDDLEASHGSTTGQLDERQLFYLQSRGISQVEARKMLILAFANEIIESIEDENVRDRVHSEFEIAYYGKSELECFETCHGCEDLMLGAKNENN
jgi:Fe-S cluster assembly protein SufD